MWILKPIYALISTIIFLITTVVTAIGTATLLTSDLLQIPFLPDKTIVLFLFISIIIVIFSAAFLYFRFNLVIQELKFKLDEKRNMQRKIDHLAKLREKGINRIYAITPNKENYKKWEKKYHAWKKKVRKYLKLNFPFAVFEMFTDLGLINPILFTHASKDPVIRDQHIHCLQMFAKELGIIESLIRDNTNLNKETQPTLKELLIWYDQLD